MSPALIHIGRSIVFASRCGQTGRELGVPCKSRLLVRGLDSAEEDVASWALGLLEGGYIPLREPSWTIRKLSAFQRGLQQAPKQIDLNMVKDLQARQTALEC